MACFDIHCPRCGWNGSPNYSCDHGTEPTPSEVKQRRLAAEELASATQAEQGDNPTGPTTVHTRIGSTSIWAVAGGVHAKRIPVEYKHPGWTRAFPDDEASRAFKLALIGHESNDDATEKEMTTTMPKRIKITTAPPVEAKHGITVGREFDIARFARGKERPILFVMGDAGEEVGLHFREYEKVVSS